MGIISGDMCVCVGEGLKAWSAGFIGVLGAIKVWSSSYLGHPSTCNWFVGRESIVRPTIDFFARYNIEIA